MRKVYATSDWHGIDKKLIEKILQWLKPEDTLVILGDVIDRGEDGIDLLEMIMADSRCLLLKGNHEQMMIDTYQTHTRSSWNLWMQNGGEATENAFYKRTEQERKKIIKFLSEAPIKWCFRFGKKIILLEHAGYTPTLEYNHDPLWDRYHFIESWPKDKENTYIVHGHTPVQYLKFEFDYCGKDAQGSLDEEMEIKRQWYENGIIDWKPTILCYCDGHKFDIDMGAISSKRIALLDLDTFEPIYFDEKEGE